MRYITILLLFSLSFVAGTSHCQEVWSLERSVTHALKNSIGILQSDIATSNAEIDLEVAKQARYPNLSAGTNLSWNFGRTIDPTSNSFITETFFSNNYSLGSGVLLYNGSRIKNTIKRREIDLKATQADAQQVAQDLSLTVAISYLNVLFALENIDISEKQVQLNSQQLERTNKSISAGILPAAERLSLEAQLAQSEQGVIVAKNTYDIALLQLKQYLRLDASTDITVEVPQNVDVETNPDLLTLDELLAKTIGNRYDLKAATLRAEASELDVTLAKSGYYPTISLFGNLGTNYSNQAREIVGFESETVDTEVTFNGNPVTFSQTFDSPLFGRPGFGTQLDNFLSYGFGVGVNIPIYSNGVNKANVARAKLGIEGQRLQKQQLVENLKANLQQSLSDARAAKKTLEASDKSIAAQKAAFDSVTKRLDIGAANSFEWETQKTQLENLEIQRLTNKYDYLFKVKILEFYLGKKLKF